MWQIINEFICLSIAVLGTYLFGRIVLNQPIKIEKKKFILIFIITSLIHALLSFYLSGIIKTLLMGITEVYFYMITFHINKSKSIFLTVIYMIVLMLLDLIELFFITTILKITTEFIYNTYAGSVISNIVASVTLVIITLIFRKLLRKIINSKISNNLKIIILSVLTLTSILMFFYTFIKEFRFSNNIFMYLVAIIVFVSILFSLVKQTIENNKLTNEYDKLLEFMTTYENEIENQRILRHETKNEFLIIKGKIQDKEKNKEIINYINEILKEKIEVKQEEYAKFGYLPANGIKGLCYLKVQEAQSKGIKTNINVSKRIKNSSIYKLDIKQQRNLGKILGVILDNSIEASVESEEKIIGVEAYLIKDECQIIISNSYSNEDINKISNNKLSSKGKNRGHGLLLVKSIINSNKIFNLETNVTDKLYIQKIVIKNFNSK